jgi:hypothetical protein
MDKILKRYIKTKLTDNEEENPDEETLLEDVRNQQLSKHQADKREEEQVFVYISSAKRDKSVFPSPSFYELDLDAEIDNIVEASLIQANFPIFADNVIGLSIMYSFLPFTSITTVNIPNGIYKGKSLAVEITRQLNQVLHEASLVANTSYIDDSSGAVFDPNTKAPVIGVDQFRVTFNWETKEMIFQLYNGDSVSTTPFALHFPRNARAFEILGFSSIKVLEEGVYELLSNTFYLATNVPSSFVTSASPDKRIRYSIRGNLAPNLRGELIIILDISPLNGSASVTGNHEGRFFGTIPIKPSFCNDNVLEINSHTYPVKQVYRNGVSRVKQLFIQLLRADGTYFDFHGLEHFFALKITVKRTQPDKPIFCR